MQPSAESKEIAAGIPVPVAGSGDRVACPDDSETRRPGRKVRGVRFSAGRRRPAHAARMRDSQEVQTCSKGNRRPRSMR